MIDYSLRSCVERGITVRRCKNCGRWFPQTGRVSAEYCERPVASGQQTCREAGAFQQWTKKQSDDPVFKAYRKEYKKRFAWKMCIRDRAYMDHLADAFLFTECKRWDVKGKNYFDYPNKYYCEDIGLRNARIGFRQQEMTHIMENIIFNELMVRECAVDIGIVYSNERNAKGKLTPVAREIDFIAASGGKKTYIQSAYALGTEEKSVTENKPLSLTGDSFPKIIVRHDIRKRWYDDNGILNIGVLDFLLDDTLV